MNSIFNLQLKSTQTRQERCQRRPVLQTRLSACPVRGGDLLRCACPCRAHVLWDPLLGSRNKYEMYVFEEGPYCLKHTYGG